MGPGSRYFRHDGTSDRAGAGHGFLGLECDVRNAPRRPRRTPGRGPADRRGSHGAPLHRLRTERRSWHGSRSQTVRLPKPTLWSPPTASTPSFGPTCFLRPDPVFSGSVAYRGVLAHERVPHWPTDAWLMWLGKAKHFLTFPVRAGQAHQLRRIRAGGRADEGIVVGARRSRCASRGSSPAGIRASRSLLQQVQMTFRWALYDREPLPTWTRGTADAARRRRASDASASRAGRQPVDRGWNGARDDPRARGSRRPRRRRFSLMSASAASAWRRSSVARARTVCGTIPPTRTWASATPRSPPRCIPQAALRPRCGAGSAGRCDGPYVVRAAIPMCRIMHFTV